VVGVALPAVMTLVLGFLAWVVDSNRTFGLGLLPIAAAVGVPVGGLVGPLNAHRVWRAKAGDLAVITTQAIAVGAVLVAIAMTAWIVVGGSGISGDPQEPIVEAASAVLGVSLLLGLVLICGLLLFGLPAWLFTFPIVWIWAIAVRRLAVAGDLAV
jgi:hypothetical protein